MYVKTFHMWSIGFLDLKNIENMQQYHRCRMSFSRFIVKNVFWWRNCNQSIAVRVVIVCFRLSDFLLIFSRTTAEQTSSTDNVHNNDLFWSYFASVMSDVTSTVGLHCCCPVDRISSLSISESVLAVSRLGSYVSLVGNGIWYAFATRMVINAASINMWPPTALEIVFPVNIKSCRIANTSLRSSCSHEPIIECRYYKLS